MKISVVVYRRNELEKIGILKIRIFDKKTTYISLKEKINLVDFSESKQRVKSTHPKANYLNNLIEKKLSEIKDKNKTFEFITETDGNEIGFSDFATRFIKNQKTIGSKKKYTTVVRNFNAYIQGAFNRENILLKDINEEIIENYTNFLLEDSDLQESTCYRYLKYLKTILNKAIELNKINYLRHPFITTKFKNIITHKEYLNEDEVHRINNLSYENDTYLGVTKNMAIFQIYCQGMRVSDTLLVRFQDIQDDYITIRIRKTQKTLKIFINEVLKKIILQSIDNYNIREKSNIEAAELNLGDSYDSYDDVYEKYEELYNLIKREELELNFIKEEERDYSKIRIYKRNLNSLFIKLIKKAKKFIKNEFIFIGYLNSEDFINFKSLDRLNAFQFNQISSKVAMYNKRLKTIQRDAQIDKTLTSHIFRHTFANLALSQKNADIYAISQALAHSSVRETEIYLRNFNSKKVENLMYKISSSFSGINGLEIPNEDD